MRVSSEVCIEGIISTDMKKCPPRLFTVPLTTIRQNNSGVLLEIISQNPRISRTELSHISGFSPSLVTKICSDLMDRNLIREIGIGHSSGGRRPVYIELNHEAYYVGCVHTSLASSSVALCDCCGSIRKYCRLANQAPILSAESLSEIADKLCIDSNDSCRAIGITFEDLLFHEAENYQLYSTKKDQPFLAIRSSVAALIGLNKYIYKERYQDCAYIRIGPKIYGAVLSSGVPLTGSGNQIGSNWYKLDIAQEIVAALQRGDDLFGARLIIELGKFVQQLYDVDLVVLDLFDRSLSDEFRNCVKEHMLQAANINFDLLPYPTLVHRGMAFMLSNLIGSRTGSLQIKSQ